MEIVKEWFRRHFSNPQVVILAVLLLLGLLIIVLAGEILAPVIAALIIAYLLDSPAERMCRRGVPRFASVLVMFMTFVGVTLAAVFLLVPVLARQVKELIEQMPQILHRIEVELTRLRETYPEFIDQDQIRDLMATLGKELPGVGQWLLQTSLESLTSLVTIVVYAILVPLMVFFFLKDKAAIQAWFKNMLPTQRPLAEQVWREVDYKCGQYVRGKVYEIIIVGVVTWAVFKMIGIEFAMLLAVLTGFSVLIPYVGAAVVFFPCAIVAFTQWGWGTDFFVACVAYGVIQALDGNLLAPLLFSEVVKLHPNAIILAILVFGGIWGFWGLFFAIPLATLAAAVINAWPKKPPDAEAIPPPEVETEAAE